MTDPYEGIAIEYFDGDRLLTADEARPAILTVRTSGLTKRKHPEFELVNVPVPFENEAAMLLSTAGGSALERRPFAEGRPWATRLPDGFLVAANVKKLGSGVLRLFDADSSDPDSPAKTALCAMAVSRSRIVRSEDPERAERILESALTWFPGDPGDGLAFANDELCNQNNSLAYLARSEHASTIEDEEADYARALERCRSLRMAEMGGPIPEPIERKVLAADVSSLITLLQTASRGGRDGWGAAPPRGMAFLFSPILRFDGDGMKQSLAIGMPAFRKYYFEGPVAEQLRSSQVRELAVEIYERWVEHYVGALVLSCDTARGIYESGYRFDDSPPKRPFVFRSLTGATNHVPFLSRILAALGRELAAEISSDEMRARWGLVDDAGLARSAAAKLNAMRRAEELSIRATYD